jgi:hypothetical protein
MAPYTFQNVSLRVFYLKKKNIILLNFLIFKHAFQSTCFTIGASDPLTLGNHVLFSMEFGLKQSN